MYIGIFRYVRSKICRSQESDEKRWDLCIRDDRLRDVIRKYKEADENKPDTLMDQMDALQKIGFPDVGYYYKNGIFAMFGGRNNNEGIGTL